MEWLRQLAGLLGRRDRPVGEQRQIKLVQSEVPDSAELPPVNTVGVEQARHNQAVPEVRPFVEDLSQAQQIVREICTEALAARPSRFDHVDLKNSPRWIALKSETAERQAEVAWAAYQGEPDRNSPYYWRSLEHGEPRRAIFKYGLARLPFRTEWLLHLLQDWLKDNLTWDRAYSGHTLIRAVERLAARQALPLEMQVVLKAIAELFRRGGHRYVSVSHSQLARLIERLIRLTGSSVPDRQKTLPYDPLGNAIRQWLKALNPDEREPWLKLILLCTDLHDKARPSGKWLKEAKQAIEGMDISQVASRLFELLSTVDLLGGDWKFGFEKGLLWTTTLLEHSAVAGDVGRLAERWLRGSPNSVGNAALWALSEMAGEPRAAAELFRLREKIKRHGTRTLIDRRLVELAKKGATTVGDLEDYSLPSFGLDENSRLSQSFDEARVELAVGATGTSQQWINASGKAVKSVPAEVRLNFADAFSAFRQQAKDVDAARQLQAARLEQSWTEERSWSFQDWQRHFLRHPLRRPIVSALIWRINGLAVMPADETLKNVLGNACAFQAHDRVSLWHPLNSDPAEVLAWRARILERDLTQPIKQVHREIYVLTDAERTTRTYSNRFAAHIIRQHQFTKICQARGWRYKLMGDWDGWNQPTRALPKQNMIAEFHVDTLEGPEHAAHSGVALYISSDQVRFLDMERRAVELERIAPIVFSEVMRDVDLFVAVSSVANDPNWTDGGPNGQYRDYWQEWAFGDVGQSAISRRDLATWLVPKLSIADKLEITDKFLIVQGKRQKYAIHFGSSNIQILPSNRYLCIVPDRQPKETRNIRLPFEGDSLFSTILAKAFLLVDESKIKDETILRQL